MSEHDQVQALHLDRLLTLKEVSVLEEVLRPHLQGLMSHAWQPRSRDPAHAHFAGRPGWWWRVRIIEWAGSLTTRRRVDLETLRGFSEFVRHCSEAEVCDLVRGLVEQAGIKESA